MATNACGTALNTGQPNCVPNFKVDTGIILLPYLADDGTVNSIKTTDTFDTSYVTARLNAGIVGTSGAALSRSQRWYPLMGLKAVIGERAENTTQDIEGVAYNVKAGVRNYDGTIYGNAGSPKLLKALESRNATKDSYFKVDINGNLVGIVDETTGDMNPIRIEQSTFSPRLMDAKDAEVQALNLKFTVDTREKDSDLGILTSATISADLLEIQGLVDVVGAATVPTTTTVTLTANFIYGDAFVPKKFTGAVLADFPVYNVTTALAVVPASVIETPVDSGIYLFTYAAQTASDVMTINLAKDGFEMSEVTFTV